MKISEMTLEQLQDYALQLEQDKSTLTDQLTAKDNELKESNDLNKQLQKRNNDLFMRVEQGKTGATEPPAPVESLEDFSKNLASKF